MRPIPSLLPLLLTTSFSYLQKQRGSDSLEPREMLPRSASRPVLPSGLWVPDEGHVPFQPIPQVSRGSCRKDARPPHPESLCPSSSQVLTIPILWDQWSKARVH